MPTVEELEAVVIDNASDIATLQYDVASNSTAIAGVRSDFATLQVTTVGNSNDILELDIELNRFIERMDTVENTIYGGSYSNALREINLRIDTNIVGVAGNSAGVYNALSQAFDAYTKSVVAEINANGYTDTRIQRLRDEFLVLLQNFYLNAIGEADRNSRASDDEALVGWTGSWEDRYREMMEQAEAALDFYDEMTDWTDNTFEVLIPHIMEEITLAKEYAEEARQLAQSKADAGMQDILEMAGRWRDIAGSIEDMRDGIIEMDYSNYQAVDSIYRRVSEDFNGRFSEYNERITAAASATGGVVDKVEQLSVKFEDQEANFTDVVRAMIEGDDQLSQQITSLSVGAQTQFDTAEIWHFDTSNEGWSGLWEDGWLIVNGNSIQSPPLNIDATRYRQVKMRLRKVGEPDWDGRMNWLGATPAGPINLEEPNWVGEYSEITVNPAWTGMLSSLVLYLSTNADSQNYYILDWITVGRPAPGASTASVLAERTARIEQDAVSALRIDVLNAELVSMDGRLSGSATAIDGLLSRVEVTEEGITATNEAMTILESSVTDVVTGISSNSEAIQGLVTLNSVQGDTITALAEEVTLLRSSIGDAVVVAYDELQTQVTRQGESLTLAADKITNLEASLGSFASGSALAALSVTVTNQGTDINRIISQDLVNLRAGVNNAATSGALTLLAADVQQNGRDITSTSRRITNLEVAVPNLASASAFDELRSKVNHSTTGLDAQATRITNLNASLRRNVEAWSLAYVKSQVTDDLEGTLTAQTESIQTYGAQIGRMRANGLFQVTATATPTGARTRIGLVAQASAGDVSYRAALYLQANTDGTSNVQVVANRFSIINVLNGSDAVAPFIVAGGRIYLNAETMIRSASIGRLKIGDNEIYADYFFETGNVRIRRDRTKNNPILIMSQNITGFEGGGFTVTFSAYADNTDTVDSFGSLYLTVNGRVVDRQRFGVRSSGGGDVKFIIPVSLVGSTATNATSVRIQVWGYASHWNSDDYGSNDVTITNCSLTVSGSRR